MRLWQGTYARAVLLALLILFALPGAALAAEPVFEKYKVPDGRRRRDQRRGDAARGQPGRAGDPHLLAVQHAVREPTTPNLANDDLGQRYVPNGYARAVADVLGTRNSSGLLGLRRRRRSSSPAWTS